MAGKKWKFFQSAELSPDGHDSMGFYGEKSFVSGLKGSVIARRERLWEFSF